MKKALLVLLSAVLLCTLMVACKKEEPLAGGFTKQREVTAEEISLFETALGEEATNYTPLKVATQVVAGTNYRFYAKSTSSKEHFYITIFVSLDENEAPAVTDISAA